MLHEISRFLARCVVNKLHVCQKLHCFNDSPATRFLSLRKWKVTGNLLLSGTVHYVNYSCIVQLLTKQDLPCCTRLACSPSLTSYNMRMHSWPICLSVVIIICLPQKEKPHALTAVFVSYLDNVVAVSQSQNLKLLSADPEMKCFVSPEDRMSQVKEVQPCLCVVAKFT